ncbi:MAG: hypothetical protein HRT80_04900 [Henriciella sp.]|nr:hypothetical protein [Henriciella sp.]
MPGAKIKVPHFMSERPFQLIRTGEEAFEFEVMIYGGALTSRRPLLIFHSIEFPLPPSTTFCDAMWEEGLQVVFVRRAGFGKSSPLPRAMIVDDVVRSGATAVAEAVMMRQLIATLNLQNIVLLAMGSSNLVAYRLVKLAPEINFTIFANPVFNQDIFQVFTPLWFRTMLKQIMTSKSGLRVAIRGMKLLIRKDPVAFYNHIYHKNEHDLRYIEENAEDYREAGDYALATDPAQLFYDAIMLLDHDPLLRDGYFSDTFGTILIGKDSAEHWRTQMRLEADRLGLPIVQAPEGDLSCAYASPETVLSIIEVNTHLSVYAIT